MTAARTFTATTTAGRTTFAGRRRAFALGTAATVAKEVIRLVAVDREHVRTGLVQIAKGWRDSHKLMHDPKWRPMPPLVRQ